MMRSLRLFSVGILAGLLAMSAAADDKDFLRPRADSVPPNLLIVFGNSQTMTQTLSFVGGNFSTFDGDADSPASKLGSAKRVIQQFVQDFHTDYNIGLTTFAHDSNSNTAIRIRSKHWVYVAVGTLAGLGKVDYPGDLFAEPVGTMERWGPAGEGPCTTKTDPPCNDRSPRITLDSSATISGPFFGSTGDGDAYIYLNGGSPADATERIHVKMVPGEGEYGDGYSDGTLTAFLRGTYSVKVLKTYQKRLNRNVDWPTGASETPAKNPGAVEVLYRPLGAPVPPSTDPPDSSLFYPVGKEDAAGNPIEGQSVGFLNDPKGDFDVFGNCAGWEFQANNAQVPLVKIPRDYYWGPSCQPPQDSLSCVKRLLRPQAYIESYDPVSGNFTTADPDNPGYTGTGSKYADGCDRELLGAYQASDDVVNNTAILTNRNGSQVPLKNLLVNILSYFKNPQFDNFYNGARLDDPNAACRTSAVILIYDSSIGCQNDSCGFLKNQALDELKRIGVPVFVIGFGASVGNTQQCAGSPDTLTDTCPLVCIPRNTGAFQSDGTTVGYFPVTDSVSLYNALATIADLVNESQKGFASSTVATAQANGEQVAFLATFNALNNRTIWNGRINAYKLTESGSILQGQRTIRDAQDPNNLVTLPAPSNDPLTSLMWNAGENLADTPGFGATDPTARLQPGAARSTSTYLDSSNDGAPKSVPTSFYPGRKIVFSLPASYPDPTQQTTRLPLQSLNDTVPENRFDMISPPGSPPFTTPPAEWQALRALLSPQPVPPVTTSTGGKSPHEIGPPITDEDAVNSIRFIWGDRDAIILAARPSAPATALYAATAADRAAGKGLKMGDVFHSSPLLVGPPGNFAYFTQNLHDYEAFRTTYQQRRRVLAFGANDGLLHVVDAGAWDRNRDACDFEADGVTRKHCFDLGTGAELFAYAPRATMQIFKPLKDVIGLQTRRMEWTVDGPVTGGDVFIDANHSAAPVASARAWHTVVIGGMREGSPFEGTSGAAPADSQGSYYALDITQPDSLGSDSNGKPITKTPANYDAPLCLNADGDSTCGHDASDQAVRDAQPPRAWPTVLWEITDVGDLDASGTTGATFVDMGETWSKPALGRVKVCTSACGTQTPVNEDHYVAIFGGGFDRERLNRRGNWLYMVDVETAKVLYRTNSGCADGTSAGCSPVYFASVPSEPAAVDGNGDGFIDVVYVGDLNGRMWRIDTTDLRLDSSKTDRWSNKIDVDAGTGRPFLLFEAPQPATPAVPPRPNPSGHPFYPIYYRPTIISLGYNVGGKPAVGVGFGTGDRDDITGNLEPLGLTYKQRFYYVVDRNNDTTLKEGAADFLDITSTTAPSVTTAPANGWFLELPLGERVNADLLTVGGVIYFTTFNPLAAGNPSNTCAQNSPDCGLANGTARLYRVNYATGNPYLGADRGQTQPYGGFLSEPVYFQAVDQTGNIIYTTENTVKTETAPGGKKTSVKSWKERSRRP